MSVSYLLDSALRDRQACPDPLNYKLNPSQVETWSRSGKNLKAKDASSTKRVTDFAHTVNVLSMSMPYPKPELFGPLLATTSIDGAGNLIFATPPNLVVGDIIWTSSSNGAPFGVPVDTQLYVVALSGPTGIQFSSYAGGPALPLSPATSLIMNFVLYSPTVAEKYAESKILLTSPILFLILRCENRKDNRGIRCIDGTHSEATHILQRSDMTPAPDGTPGFLNFHCRAEQTCRWSLDEPIEIGVESRDGQLITVFKETIDQQKQDLDPYRQTIIHFIVTPFIMDATYSNQFVEVYEG